MLAVALHRGKHGGFAGTVIQVWYQIEKSQAIDFRPLREESQMSTDPENTTAQWRLTLAVIEARIEDLKIRSDTEYRALHNRLDTQIRSLQRELNKLSAEVAAAEPDAYIQNISARLSELKAKGDAAFELLQSTTATNDNKQNAKPPQA